MTKDTTPNAAQRQAQANADALAAAKAKTKAPQPVVDQDQRHPSLHPHTNPPQHRGELSTPTPERGGEPAKPLPIPPGAENDDPQKPGLHPQTEKTPLAIPSGAPMKGPANNPQRAGDPLAPAPAPDAAAEYDSARQVPPTAEERARAEAALQERQQNARNKPATKAGEIAPIAGAEDLAPPPPRANHPHIAVDPPAVPLTTAQITGMPPNNSVPSRGPVKAKTVRVELVWPAERGPKMDCQGGTQIIWTGHGDVQDYPADQWHKLAPHPGVWKLVNEDDIKVANQAQVDRVESPENRLERLQRERKIGVTGIDGPFEEQRLDAERIRARAAETDRDAVVVGPSMGRPATEHAPTRPVPERVSNELAPSTYDAIALAPHTQTAALEAAARAEAAAAVPAGMVKGGRTDEFDPPAPVPPALRQPPPGQHATKALKPTHYSAEQLEGLSDADVRGEGAKRGYTLHPRLTPINLRARFLELQD